MKRILCFISSLGSGGAERQMVGLATFLKNRGHQVKVAWYSSDSFYEQFLIDHDVERLQFQANNAFSSIMGLRKVVLDYKPDIVIAFLKRPTMYACVLKALGFKYKLIVSERNITIGNMDFSQRLKFFLFNFSDMIVPNSHTQGQFISNRFPALKGKIHVINNFADLVYFQPPSTKRLNCPRVFLVAARITEQKNVNAFLKAVRITKEKGASYRVLWFGSSFPVSYGEKCEQLRQELQLNDMVSFYPATKDIRSEYYNADVFCLPSLYEGFPNVIGEAMSCGLPIICSNVSDNPRLVHEGVNGFLFDPTDIESIADCLLRMSQLSNEVLIKMGERSRELAKNLLSMESFINNYQSLIESL